MYYGFIRRQTNQPTKNVTVGSKGKPVSQLNILRLNQKAEVSKLNILRLNQKANQSTN